MANDLKRKRVYPSSPPPDLHDLAHDLAGTEALQQETQKEWDARADCIAYEQWNGRGRSPFKTPATAALDRLKDKAHLLEDLERDISHYQNQLDSLIDTKRARLCNIHQSRSDITRDESGSGGEQRAQAKEMASSSTPVLQPTPRNRSRSISPSKYLAKLAQGTPSITCYPVETTSKQIPKSVRETKSTLQSGLEIGCMPQQCKVAMPEGSSSTEEAKSQ